MVLAPCRASSVICAGNPLFSVLGISLAPPINADFTITFDVNSDGDIEYAVSGSHDGFPAYELYVDQQLVYSWDPVAEGTSPFALLSPPPRGVSNPGGGALEAIIVNIEPTVLFDSIGG